MSYKANVLKAFIQHTVKEYGLEDVATSPMDKYSCLDWIENFYEHIPKIEESICVDCCEVKVYESRTFDQGETERLVGISFCPQCKKSTVLEEGCFK